MNSPETGSEKKGWHNSDMTKEKLERINTLAKKKKTEGLNERELAEQRALYAEYLAEIRLSFGSMLENTVIKRPDGTVERVKDRFKKD